MIKNEKQLRITRDWIKKFRGSVANMEKIESPSVFDRIGINGLKSQISDMEDQIKEYDRTKRSKPVIKETSVEELPKMLIRARIASGITEKELAGMVGISEEQLQRHEEFDYQDASLSKIEEILFVLKNKRPFAVHNEQGLTEILE